MTELPQNLYGSLGMGGVALMWPLLAAWRVVVAVEEEKGLIRANQYQKLSRNLGGKQSNKTFLHEMLVGRERLTDLALTHQDETDRVAQRIGFIQPLVQ